MASRVEKKEEAAWGIEKVRAYAKAHKKYAGFMYGGVVKDVRALGITGRFLEMGAGPGFLAVMLAREYPDISITAVDILPTMATVASEYITENGLKDRINYVVGDVNDSDFMRKLGKFDFVCSTFSLHDWKPPDNAIGNLWEAVGENGALYLHDFRRLGFLRFLPVNDEGLKSMQAAYTPDEVRDVLARTGITDYTIKNAFPYIYLIAIARKGS
jgi:SAM-dependent methyltransferase